MLLDPCHTQWVLLGHPKDTAQHDPGWFWGVSMGLFDPELVLQELQCPNWIPHG